MCRDLGGHGDLDVMGDASLSAPGPAALVGTWTLRLQLPRPSLGLGGGRATWARRGRDHHDIA